MIPSLTDSRILQREQTLRYAATEMYNDLPACEPAMRPNQPVSEAEMARLTQECMNVLSVEATHVFMRFVREREEMLREVARMRRQEVSK